MITIYVVLLTKNIFYFKKYLQRNYFNEITAMAQCLHTQPFSSHLMLMNHYYNHILPSIFYDGLELNLGNDNVLKFVGIKMIKPNNLRETLLYNKHYEVEIVARIIHYYKKIFVTESKQLSICKIPVMVGSVFDEDFSISIGEKYINHLLCSFICDGHIKIGHYEEQNKYNIPIFVMKSYKVSFSSATYVDENVKLKLLQRKNRNFLDVQGSLSIKFFHTKNVEKGTMWYFFTFEGMKITQFLYGGETYIFDHEEKSENYILYLSKYVIYKNVEIEDVYMYFTNMFDILNDYIYKCKKEDGLFGNSAFLYKHIISVSKYFHWHTSTIPTHICNILKRKLIKSTKNISFLENIEFFLKDLQQINNKLLHALKTNNWNIIFRKRKTNAVLNIVESLDLEKNHFVYIDQLNKISSSVNNIGNKVDEMRQYDKSSRLFICPYNSPDGRKIGLIKQLTTGVIISDYINIDYVVILNVLSNFYKKIENVNNTKDYYYVTVNGCLVSIVEPRNDVIFNKLSVIKKIKKLNQYISFVIKKKTINIDIMIGRPMIRVAFSKRTNLLIDNYECYNLQIQDLILKNMEFSNVYPRICCDYTAFSSIVSWIPNYKFTDGKRLLYATRMFHRAITNRCLQGKYYLIYPQHALNDIKFQEKLIFLKYYKNFEESVFLPSSPLPTYEEPKFIYDSYTPPTSPNYIPESFNFNKRKAEDNDDNISPNKKRAISPSYIPKSPISKSPTDEKKHDDEINEIIYKNISKCIFQNVIVLHMNDLNNMEDGIIVNKSSLERGLFTYVEKKTITYKLKPNTIYGIIDKDKFPNLDDDGMLKVNCVIKDENEVLINEIYIGLNKKNKIELYDNIAYTASQAKVMLYKLVKKKTTNTTVVFTFERMKTLTVGDKMSSRHGQKGVVCKIEDVASLPFTADGTYPDLIINANSSLKRLTIGLFKEMQSTPIGEKLTCTFSGITGEFIGYHQWGMVSYKLLDQIAENKKFLCVPSNTNRQLTTGQPKEGRSQDGGFRIGIQEVAAIRSSGGINFLQDRLFESSDKIKIKICSVCRIVQHLKLNSDNSYYCYFCKSNIKPLTYNISKCMKYIIQLCSMANVKISL